MVIYGVALLAACFLGGILLGDMIGLLIGVKANVGGVGFAMLFLIVLTNLGIERGWLDAKSQGGIAFWSGMYIPIIVAMSASQDVVAALSGGPIAFAAGFLGVAVAFALVPMLTRMSRSTDAPAP